ncbi:hypothetical protein LRR80_06642 [Streptomyces sp. RO-S4]|nr:hypothetical protein [Streptomyces sp. RO-S4]
MTVQPTRQGGVGLAHRRGKRFLPVCRDSKATPAGRQGSARERSEGFRIGVVIRQRGPASLGRDLTYIAPNVFLVAPNRKERTHENHSHD